MQSAIIIIVLGRGKPWPSLLLWLGLPQEERSQASSSLKASFVYLGSADRPQGKANPSKSFANVLECSYLHFSGGGVHSCYQIPQLICDLTPPHHHSSSPKNSFNTLQKGVMEQGL